MSQTITSNAMIVAPRIKAFRKAALFFRTVSSPRSLKPHSPVCSAYGHRGFPLQTAAARNPKFPPSGEHDRLVPVHEDPALHVRQHSPCQHDLLQIPALAHQIRNAVAVLKGDAVGRAI